MKQKPDLNKVYDALGVALSEFPEDNFQMTQQDLKLMTRILKLRTAVLKRNGQLKKKDKS